MPRGEGVSPPVYVLCGPFTFRQLFSPKVIWPTPRANVPACGKPAGLRQPFAARYATTGYTRTWIIVNPFLAGPDRRRMSSESSVRNGEARRFSLL